MTRKLGQRPELKGREVTYDVSCMDRKQLLQTFGIADLDTDAALPGVMLQTRNEAPQKASGIAPM